MLNNFFVKEALNAVGVDYPVSIKYSGRFKGYNANIRLYAGLLEFRLSKKWLDIDLDIQKGVVQHLACRLFKLQVRTLEQDLYDNFMQRVGVYAERVVSDPLLIERFNVLNNEYFGGLMQQPNLVWGRCSTTKLGSYTYSTDTVVLSTILKEDIDLLDYVLYHELLHKKHGVSCSNGRNIHHSREFRADEKKFRIKNIDDKLRVFVRKKKKASSKRWFWWRF